jgi:hypothetical protein
MRFIPIALGLLIFSVVCAHAFTPELIRGRHVCVYAGNLLDGRAYYGADGTYSYTKGGKTYRGTWRATPNGARIAMEGGRTRLDDVDLSSGTLRNQIGQVYSAKRC